MRKIGAVAGAIKQALVHRHEKLDIITQQHFYSDLNGESTKISFFYSDYMSWRVMNWTKCHKTFDTSKKREENKNYDTLGSAVMVNDSVCANRINDRIP